MSGTCWDAPPTDPIADIRRGVEAQEQRAKRDAVMVPFHNARLAALSRLARARAATTSRPDEPHDMTRVWLCDEHGILAMPDPRGSESPMRVPRALAEFLGAEFRDGMAHLKLGVPAPEAT